MKTQYYDKVLTPPPPPPPTAKTATASETAIAILTVTLHHSPICSLALTAKITLYPPSSPAKDCVSTNVSPAGLSVVKHWPRLVSVGRRSSPQQLCLQEEADGVGESE